MGEHSGDPLSVETRRRAEGGHHDGPHLLLGRQLVGSGGRRCRAQRRHQRPHEHRSLLGPLRGLLEETDQPLSRRVTGDARSLDSTSGPAEPTGQTGHEKLVLSGEIAIDGAERHSRLFGDGPHLHGLVATFAGHSHRRLEHTSLSVALGSCAPRLFIGHPASLEHDPKRVRITR